jgi:hypothetical protein
LEGLEELDAFQLDAAMRRVRLFLQQRQARFGDSLGLFLDLELHRELGYSTAGSYIRERLGIPERTARELVRTARAAHTRSADFASAYARGDLSWLQVLTLLPVLRFSNATAWIERAGEVTLRRLADEVEWTMRRVDLDPANAAAMLPPSGDALDAFRAFSAGDALGMGGPNDERQMCADGNGGESNADGASEELWGILGRIHVTFVAPLSISVLFRSVMQGFASPYEPRWKALERMLEHVLGQWRNQPRHRDPVFERDGYRCTAPCCNSFTNLHDHHIIPRSAGGSNDLSNRTTLCAWHHLRAVHGGLARAAGCAPDGIEWELGLSPDKAPLLRFRGDRYMHAAGG